MKKCSGVNCEEGKPCKRVKGAKRDREQLLKKAKAWRQERAFKEIARVQKTIEDKLIQEYLGRNQS